MAERVGAALEIVVGSERMAVACVMCTVPLLSGEQIACIVMFLWQRLLVSALGRKCAVTVGIPVPPECGGQVQACLTMRVAGLFVSVY